MRVVNYVSIYLDRIWNRMTDFLQNTFQGFLLPCASQPPRKCEVFSRKDYANRFGIAKPNLRQASLVINMLEMLLSNQHQVPWTWTASQGTKRNSILFKNLSLSSFYEIPHSHWYERSLYLNIKDSIEGVIMAAFRLDARAQCPSTVPVFDSFFQVPTPAFGHGSTRSRPCTRALNWALTYRVPSVWTQHHFVPVDGH